MPDFGALASLIQGGGGATMGQQAGLNLRQTQQALVQGAQTIQTQQMALDDKKRQLQAAAAAWAAMQQGGQAGGVGGLPQGPGGPPPPPQGPQPMAPGQPSVPSQPQGQQVQAPAAPTPRPAQTTDAGQRQPVPVAPTAPGGQPQQAAPSGPPTDTDTGAPAFNADATKQAQNFLGQIVQAVKKANPDEKDPAVLLAAVQQNMKAFQKAAAITDPSIKMEMENQLKLSQMDMQYQLKTQALTDQQERLNLQTQYNNDRMQFMYQNMNNNDAYRDKKLAESQWATQYREQAITGRAQAAQGDKAKNLQVAANYKNLFEIRDNLTRMKNGLNPPPDFDKQWASVNQQILALSKSNPWLPPPTAIVNPPPMPADGGQRDSSFDPPQGGQAAPAAAPKPGAAPAKAGASKDSPVVPKSKDEAAKLPKGTWFKDPTGAVLQKG